MKDFVSIVKVFGYDFRVEDYYVIRESDGYINISYDMDNFEFHKNFYAGKFNPHLDWTEYKMRSSYPYYQYFLGYLSEMTPGTITIRFNTLNDLTNFLCKYHPYKGRKFKLSKIESKI